MTTLTPKFKVMSPSTQVSLGQLFRDNRLLGLVLLFISKTRV